MPGRLSTGFICLVAVVFAATFPATAAASPKPIEPHPGLYFEALLPMTGGWSIYLRGSGPHRVELDVANQELAASYVTMNYATGGRVGPNGIEADLGRFGHVDLRFASRPEKSYEHFMNCGGSYREVVRSGTLTGSVEFAALAGPPKVDLERVEGEIRGPTKGVCKPVKEVVTPPEVPAPLPRAAPGLAGASKTFLARRRSGTRTIDLYAIGIGREVIDMAATTTRRFGKVTVATSVHASRGGAGGPWEDARLATGGPPARPDAATLSAGSPFSGEGRYRARPGGLGTWLGSLAVQIPGEGRVGLAGPEFDAVICGYNAPRRQRACERTVAPPHTA